MEAGLLRGALEYSEDAGLGHSEGTDHPEEEVASNALRKAEANLPRAYPLRHLYWVPQGYSFGVETTLLR